MRQAFTLTLQKNCSEKLDHSCRLATYAVEFNSEQKPKIDLIRQGCPNDLYSCEILRTSHLSNEDDIKLGEDHLAEKCKLNPKGFEGKVCRIYFKSKTSGNKVKT